MRIPVIATLLVVAAALCGCGSKNEGWVRARQGELPYGTEGLSPERQYSLAVGDRIAFKVLYYDDFNTEAVVRPDGCVTFPFVGDIRAAGFTPSQLDSIATERFAEVIVNPDIVVAVLEYTDQLVFVLGDVMHPGAFPVHTGMTVTNALSNAGGPNNYAKLTDVVLIRRETPYSVRGYKVDIQRYFDKGDFTADPYVKPYDIVYVPRTKIGKVSVFMEQFFRPIAYPISVIVRGYELVTAEERR